MFEGFTFPRGAWIPPQLLTILPEIDTLSELKVTLAALQQVLTLGRDGEIITLSEFQEMTGLDRKGVIRGIRAALERGTIIRRRVDNRYRYFLRWRAEDDVDTPFCDDAIEPAERDVKESEPSTAGGVVPLGAAPARGGAVPPVAPAPRDNAGPTAIPSEKSGVAPPNFGPPSPHASMTHISSLVHETKECVKSACMHRKLEEEMAELGVSPRVAKDILGRYEAEYIRQHLNQTWHALNVGLARQAAGWFVASLRGNWDPPRGFNPRDWEE